MLPTITIDGRLVADPELRFTNSGKAALNARIAASDSKKDANGEWQTTEQVFINATLWERDAEAAAETLTKGARVVATGRLYQREYETSAGEKRTSLELKFATLGKIPSGPPAQRSHQPAPTADPWATPQGQADDRPPF